MSNPILSKSMSILKRQSVVGDRLTFHNADDIAIDGGDINLARSVEISEQDWRDMGQPDVLTITVEPGDRLNGDAPKVESAGGLD